jgi:hypothetical protein
MEVKREWKINRNGELWTDRFRHLDKALVKLEEYQKEEPYACFELFEMTEEEISAYK